MNHSFRHVVVLSLCSWLASCASLGIPQADTFNKRVAVANSVIESTANTIQTLFVAGKLSKAESQKALDQTKSASAGIDIARKIRAEDPRGANNQLAAIITTLNALNVYLQSRQ
jgi:hypothetical protein